MSGRGRGLLRRWIDGVRGVFGAAPRAHREDTEPAEAGGPFLHWVPDHGATWRLAGDFLPPSTGRRRSPGRARRRSRRV